MGFHLDAAEDCDVSESYIVVCKSRAGSLSLSVACCSLFDVVAVPVAVVCCSLFVVVANVVVVVEERDPTIYI